MRIIITLTLLLTPMLPARALAGPDGELPGAMVMVGAWHGDEVAAADGESWLALLPTADGFELREVTIAVERVTDAVLDISPAATGKRVTVPDGGEPLVLLRDLSQLEPGPVVAAQVDDRDFRVDRPTRVSFGGAVSELGISCAGQDLSAETAECPLLLSDAGGSQALTEYPIYHPLQEDAQIASEAYPLLLWAGDLDRDGRLDLLLDLTDHYNVSAPTLLLSGAAAAGQLVRPVAVFRTTGC